jgi:hypothetical protein
VDDYKPEVIPPHQVTRVLQNYADGTRKVTAHFRSKHLSPKVVPPAKKVGERLEHEARRGHRVVWHDAARDVGQVRGPARSEREPRSAKRAERTTGYVFRGWV